MRIGGFLKQSFIDYPGEVASIIFTKGCNFRCSYCHNPSLVIPSLFNEQADLPFEEILSYLIKRKNLLTGVVFTGGEPTLQNDLPQTLTKIKEQTKLRIKLDTNGSSPGMLKCLLSENLIDYVAMDVKHCFTEDSYQKVIQVGAKEIIEKIKQSISLLFQSDIPYEYRLTIAPDFISPDEIQNIIKHLPKTSTIYLQKVRNGNNLDQTNKASFTDAELIPLLADERVKIR